MRIGFSMTGIVITLGLLSIPLLLWRDRVSPTLNQPKFTPKRNHLDF